jgi:hypothetical protein
MTKEEVKSLVCEDKESKFQFSPLICRYDLKQVL